MRNSDSAAAICGELQHGRVGGKARANNLVGHVGRALMPGRQCVLDE
jgi:hypothetical protein